ncbi:MULTISPECIES: PTS sugar transporter subunit IIB [Thermoactinomyces]|uniref:PTS sugar transporter subunit IIB n=1 Tax=Thermoactinomyces daqus TaxID=1329516 RepID=A0A7W2AJP2_9BACL|nr:PTS sugar transporter subunit IIB [Thermoactinomyces daqus]MBA4544635.1 PTS sugar transporter subunit IIB [Thermoactinomyces daqus]MBH8599722.1 PTS sugar transporter subunit IIB [Thermoactinomyces sp. CICC 10523]MBH8605892.1 PTS sugar transporter subunit IIB [Thermoactinomyces sp. CICC 10522]MBH8609309.1 PTS sugar transporter subunit IIB [Thermoactinomyces sp. CICC 10521]
MRVLMVCAGGMSSAIVVKAIKQEADKQGFALEIKAVGTHEFENELPGYDLGLVAPQVKHRFSTFAEIGKQLNVPVVLIPPTGYTPIGAPKVLELIKSYAESK